MASKKQKRGVFIALGFTDSARNFINSIRKDGYEIELKTVKQLKAEADVRKEAS